MGTGAMGFRAYRALELRDAVAGFRSYSGLDGFRTEACWSPGFGFWALRLWEEVWPVQGRTGCSIRTKRK